ncbi:unnamed protein product [Staurois parvus]|uniref:Uncharacterized protein n=1 Tax=Staurois parvus TaxID=386267 RepID=A0ABN9AHR0_9NEOB|nr:unnamed protein product [Staurois parvus]
MAPAFSSCARSLGARSTAIRSCARSLGHSETPIIGRDLCTRSRSFDH